MGFVGRCYGETSPWRVSFVSREMPGVGEYVVMEYDGRRVLGMIESLLRGVPGVTEDLNDPETVERIIRVTGGRQYVRGTVRVLGDVETLEIPRVPPGPGTEVRSADPETLGRIFGRGNLTLGRLLTASAPFTVDINRMVTRHLAVLAVTGAGKSNTVAVIVDGLLRAGGTVIIFDMHSEYVNARFTGGRVNRIGASINPAHLSLREIKRLSNVRDNAYVQERYLSRAHRMVRSGMEAGSSSPAEFFRRMDEKLDELLSENSSDRRSIIDVQNKLEHMRESYEEIIDMESEGIIERLRLNHANVIDLGSVDETGSDVIVSHVLQEVLQSRKEYLRNGTGLEAPVFIVLEEAHILAPSDRPTESRYWIGRVAREGRKFGVGLCLVSQSPKSLDHEALSQANNMIIMRLIEPNDQLHVQRASEALSDDLLSHLPSLNIGEAVVVGLMAPLPAIVRIDEFEGKLSGGDLDVAGIWSGMRVRDE
ncbi:ATPase [Methanothermobacter thermautotrophicus]|uniref:ATPase n=1 Tax=Methanothermobacter thermautotrophicus TaxID=145262 RepID=A0A842YJH0_METTF|nr:ATPase [Methanothermobacter thermautotrophicus]